MVRVLRPHCSYVSDDRLRHGLSGYRRTYSTELERCAEGWILASQDRVRLLTCTITRRDSESAAVRIG